MKLAALGVDAASGSLLPAPEDTATLASLTRDTPGIALAGYQRFALPTGMPPSALAKTGWAVVWPEGTNADIRDALAPLIRRRQEEADLYFRELSWTKEDTTARKWLKRNKAGTTVDPGKVPYYVLLAGSPAALPFEVQFDLAIAGYAVGRLDLGDDPSDWRRYAESVCRAEDLPGIRPRRIAFWATRQDESTRLSHDAFALPLAQGTPGSTRDWERSAAALCGFDVELRTDTRAQKSSLLELLRDAPALLVTASHGIGVAANEGDPFTRQGALVTQDWFGLGAPRPEDLVTAADLGPDLQMHGMVALLMACFAGGTASRDSFPWPKARPDQAARYFHGRPFVAALPRRLLTHANGPALAVLAHIDRVWGWSYAPAAVGERNGPFRTFLVRLMTGERVGHAAADLAVRTAALGALLGGMLAPDAPAVPDEDQADAWVQFRDARNYLLLGDPAVKLSAALTNPSSTGG